MCNWLLALCFFLQFHLQGDEWQTALPIPPGMSGGVNFDISVAFNASNDTVVAVWGGGNGKNSPIFFSVYDGISWSYALPLSTQSVLQNATVAYYPKTKKVIAAWGGHSDNHAYYAEFDGCSWGPTLQIPLGVSSGVNLDVTLVYDEKQGIVLAAWGDVNGNHLPFYSIYDGITWSNGAPINPGASAGVFDDVKLAYGDGIVIGAWADNNSSRIAYYSIFDGKNWLPVAGKIPLSSSVGVQSDVSLVYNSNNRTFVAAWVNQGIPAGGTPLFYSIFKGSSWTTTGLIPLGLSQGGNDNIGLAYDSHYKTVFAAWQGSEVPTGYGLAYSSIFDGSEWTPTTQIPLQNPEDSVDVNINLVYYPTAKVVVAAWANYSMTSVSGPLNPFYSTYGTPIFPPSGLAARQVKNDFGVVFEYNNVLAWNPSPTPVAQYWIYRNKELIDKIPARFLTYIDSNVIPGEKTRYSVRAVNSQGIKSPLISVTINKD